MSRAKLVAIVVVPTLLVGAVIGVLLLMDAADKREQVTRADEAGAAYDQAHDAFRADLAEQVDSTDFGDAAAVEQVVEQAAGSLPELREVTGYGAEESQVYRYAQQVSTQTAQDLTSLEEAIDGARQGQAFVATAGEALAVDPRSFLAEGALPNGEPVRREVLPPLRRNLEKFDGLDVPEGAEKAQEEVRSALAFVVAEAEKLASELDAGRGYRFEYGSRYGKAQVSVQQYGSQVEAGLREAFDRVVGDPAARV